MQIILKRAYEVADKGDGFRVLVDRKWPRGISREEAAIDLWARDVAPSTELRKWFNHDPEKWEAFSTKYRVELEAKQGALQELASALKGKKNVTLVDGAKDKEHNQAVVLQNVLKDM